jgi:hypothetical protein
MARENPLITLGVPKSVLVHEQAYGTLEGVLKIADANYKTLTKSYHPDLPTGNDALMTAFGDAIEELRDPDALAFYVEELVEVQDVQGLYLQQQSQRLVVRDAEALSRMAEGFAFFNQFEMLGITKPTSYIADLHGQRLVLDVLSSSQGRARVTDLTEDSPVGATFSTQVRYRKGVWQEFYTDAKYKEHWYPFTKFLTDELVVMVGFAPERLGASANTDTPRRNMIESSVTQVKLAWQTPPDSWFLTELCYNRDVSSHPRLVLYKHDQFAVTDQLMGSMPFTAS